MLTEEQKKQIRDEETFRKEVRESLEKEKESPAWKFLNSSFGIWLLSSVILGLITFGYTRLDKAKSESKQEAKDVAALDAEIGGRLSHFKSQAGSANTCGAYVEVVGSIITYPNFPQELYSIDPNFEKQNFRTLLTRLYFMVADDSDRKDEVKRALDGLNQIQQNARQPMADCSTRGLLVNPMTPEQVSSLKIIQSSLDANFNSAHWH